ncbi:hypothetical protein RJ640_025262 [Escallonia rubra]|uniref:HIT domain-containing protein n=1 Tax=Escallonia rubra TaxID=112253 RepID=A0AA88UFQ5_9ASTE|nr:hypothetical protein RJ640_025262 [Escallonia rubra]
MHTYTDKKNLINLYSLKCLNKKDEAIQRLKEEALDKPLPLQLAAEELRWQRSFDGRGFTESDESDVWSSVGGGGVSPDYRKPVVSSRKKPLAAAKRAEAVVGGTASSLPVNIPDWDGPEAGQTVPHVHIHILPRGRSSFENNDAIDLKEKELKQKLDLDKERKDRSLEEMVREADEYRNLFS